MRKTSFIQMMVRAMMKKVERFVCIHLTFPSVSTDLGALLYMDSTFNLSINPL